MEFKSDKESIDSESGREAVDADRAKRKEVMGSRKTKTLPLKMSMWMCHFQRYAANKGRVGGRVERRR